MLPSSMKNNQFMQRALELAKEAYKKNEVPVGAVIVDPKTNTIISEGINFSEHGKNAILHAEIIAINKACNVIGNKYLNELDLYVSLEPCPMCAYAISLSKIKRLYFGAFDKKCGGVENGPIIYNSSSTHHKPEIYGGLMEEESKELLKSFFEKLRD
ncbi:MAG: nucleoside deaminase [Sphingobacteriia bacterium]|nr:nucleoside deaminase [Sphingobacteriia bacterium]